jgi:hypothetical protein
MLIFYKKNSLQIHFHFFVFLSILIISQIVLIYPKNVFSYNAQLAWDENEEEGIAGYKIFCREKDQSYNYNVPVWVGTGITCTIYDLDDMSIYYFVARAFNTLGIESEDSEELKVELIDGEIIVNTSTESYNFVGNGCFITTGNLGF